MLWLVQAQSSGKRADQAIERQHDKVLFAVYGRFDVQLAEESGSECAALFTAAISGHDFDRFWRTLEGGLRLSSRQTCGIQSPR